MGGFGSFASVQDKRAEGGESHTNTLSHHWIKTRVWVCSWQVLENQHINMGCGKGQELYIHRHNCQPRPLRLKIMDILIQSPWFRRSLLPALFPLRIYDQHFWDQWDSDFFAPFHSLFFFQPYFGRHLSWWDAGMSEASEKVVNNYTCTNVRGDWFLEVSKMKLIISGISTVYIYIFIYAKCFTLWYAGKNG